MSTEETSVPPATATEETSELPDDIRESIATSNVQSVAGQPSMLSNLAYANLINNVNLSQQNAVSNQQAMNQLLLTVTGKLVNVLANLSPLEAAAFVRRGSGNGAARLANLVERPASMNGAQTSVAPSPTRAPPREAVTGEHASGQQSKG